MVITIKKGTRPEKLTTQINKVLSEKGVDTRKYCGSIKLKEDALKIQKQLRNEWQ